MTAPGPMKDFLLPTRDKLIRAAMLASILPIALLLRLLPRDWDLFNVSELGENVLRLLLGPPMLLFGMLGGRALETHREEFVPAPIPSLPRLVFALLCLTLFFYLLACAWSAVARSRRSAGQAAD